MLEIINKKCDLLQIRSALPDLVGLVPTMGNLHAGHLTLLEKALKECHFVFITIFVNPKQFGPQEDFNKYPRTLDNDIAQIKELTRLYQDKATYLFAPSSPDEVFDSSDFFVNVTPYDQILEGAMRPGHFKGVATVVYELFRLIKPQKAYFGLKDFQQVVVIKEMVKNLVLPIQVIPVETIRDSNGLALSSRNQYLDINEKKQALILRKTLLHILEILNNSLQNIAKAREYILQTTKDSTWNYLEIRDYENLSQDISQSKKLVILGVYQINTTRLLDNITMDVS
jgi:pantoate--beta-alanine ligase